MAIQTIRLFGDPVLTSPASPVTTFDKEFHGKIVGISNPNELKILN